MTESESATSLDFLAIGAHPDDVELFCGGTLARLSRQGKRVGLLHLTRGECGTRGTADQREKEAEAAAKVLGARQRITLDLGDGHLADNDANRRTLIETIRKLKPKVIATHALEDRHPDHIAAYNLVRAATFLSYVKGYPAAGERHKVGGLVFFLGHERRAMPQPDWIVDVSETQGTKVEALRCYGTQFFTGEEKPEEPATHISSPQFWQWIESASRRWGHLIEAEFGEAFLFQDSPHAGHPFVKMLTED